MIEDDAPIGNGSCRIPQKNLFGRLTGAPGIPGKRTKFLGDSLGVFLYVGVDELHHTAGPQTVESLPLLQFRRPDCRRTTTVLILPIV